MDKLFADNINATCVPTEAVAGRNRARFPRETQQKGLYGQMGHTVGEWQKKGQSKWTHWEDEARVECTAAFIIVYIKQQSGWDYSPCQGLATFTPMTNSLVLSLASLASINRLFLCKIMLYGWCFMARHLVMGFYWDHNVYAKRGWRVGRAPQENHSVEPSFSFSLSVCLCVCVWMDQLGFGWLVLSLRSIYRWHQNKIPWNDGSRFNIVQSFPLQPAEALNSHQTRSSLPAVLLSPGPKVLEAFSRVQHTTAV